ncbi:hypothetical protein O181_055877 [Austropuccinia psidii MF-1]|uniref:Uncharacterized protein n=1 Tax=Austropuccinia psidii MF-1 TaxID=1389203 RepID=A0A9Q3HTX9_9BASI|nr:hypothetical protein [Austropuccinia psidii MF-1]
MLEKGWNPILKAETLRKDLSEINPKDSRFNLTLGKGKNHAKSSMDYALNYDKQKWEKSHKVPDFKVGNLALAYTFNFNNIKVPKKLKDSY